MSSKVKNFSYNPKKEPPSVPFFKLFRYATKLDYFLMISGFVAAILNGICPPINSLFFGELINSFRPENTYDETMSIAGKYTGILLGIATISFLLSYISFAAWMITGERQGVQYRKAYFQALLDQEIGFYDTINPNEIASKVSFECFAIQNGIGEKFITFTYAIALVLAGFVCAYVKGWELALVISAWVPAMLIAGIVLAIAITKAIMSSQQNYYQANAVVEESLASIKTVVSLNGQEKEVSRYNSILQEALKKAKKFGFQIGLGLGLMYTGINGIYLVGLWYGSKLVEEQKINPLSDEPWSMGDIVAIYYAILYGGLSMAQITPCLKAFSSAKVAARKAFEIIDRKNKISVNSTQGTEVQLEGNIEFKNVTFSYPGAPEKMILDNISFLIRKNQKTALVGESGSGKTTCMQLIQRFYDTKSGLIEFDGNEITGMNLKSLRSRIGYVGQEPALFAASIKENLLIANEAASDAEIWEALKKANAYDFVNSLPEKLNTFVGNNGTQLSGGQKQRIAIARAILKDPKILLLDEATSALDRKNELEIQKTLDEVSKGRTTIVIAHRLATILDSDDIIVFDQGKVVEQGTHNELIKRQGKYYGLQEIQLKVAEAIHDKQETQEKRRKPQVSFEVEVDVHVPRDQAAKSALDVVKTKRAEPLEEKHVFWRLLSYNKQEAPYIVLGVIWAVINGATFPLFAIFFANVLEILSQPITPNFREDINKWLFCFLGDALVCLVSNVLQNGFFGLVGENLTLRLRTEVFRKILKMSMYWFDKPENSPGALSGKLALEAYMANNLTSSIIGNYIQTISAFTTYFVIAFASSWQLALVTSAFAPIMFYAAKIQATYTQGFSASNDAAYSKSTQIVGEVVNNMKTVASFGSEGRFFRAYETQLQGPLENASKRGKRSGFTFGLSQFTQMGLFQLTFLIGAAFVKKLDLKPKYVFQVIFAFFYTSYTSGNASQFAPDANFAKRCAKNLFKVLDYKPEIDIDDPDQKIKTPIKGEVEFKNVWFKYPTREKYILKGVSFKINPFNKVAFVGPSGCGKSTIFSLLLRFYDPESGEIFVDGINIKNYDLRHLRRSFGIVFQEPTLFNNTIQYNIKYAHDIATFEEVKKAAEDANALGFIEKNEFETSGETNNFGRGFDRQVGPKGGQISGGQKQRIAIARTIITKPIVLLLDEATSALDSYNEKVVQESLDKVMAGKTSMVVAHRISTIKDADEIFVFQEGQIVEKGNYETLTRKQGVFYKIERGLALTN